jgi:hypothetical protein
MIVGLRRILIGGCHETKIKSSNIGQRIITGFAGVQPACYGDQNSAPDSHPKREYGNNCG